MLNNIQQYVWAATCRPRLSQSATLINYARCFNMERENPMFVFNFVLILLAAVLLSNLISHFLPSLSVPIVQIILGVAITLIPFGAFGVEFDLEPELFFVLFLSPLVFHSTMTADKKTMQQMISPILLAAVVLVFITIAVAGYFTSLIIPAIPLAAAFALASALGPTDVVAVEAVSQRTVLPHKIVSILSGESIINDATGIVCFQFAVIAVVTGSFNLLHGLARFLILAVGGIAVGLILTLLKYLLVRWLRSLNITTVSLHIALGIMTPFIIFIIAEWVGVSGILAVFASGLIHSLYRDKLNPETIKLEYAQNSAWELVSFSLDGLVFIILGTQLPHIIDVDIQQLHANGIWHVVACVLLITLIMLVTRFVWWVLTVRRKVYDDPGAPVGKIRSGLIFSVAGARGTVPLASVMSIPLFLPDGSAFPDRDLIILVASGVIVVSLLLTNFILPILVDKGRDSSLEEMEQAACAEILHTVVDRLKSQMTHENFAATEIVLRNYQVRLNHYHSDGSRARGLHEKLRLRYSILRWEKDVILRMAEMGQISQIAADHYIESVENQIAEVDKGYSPMRLAVRTIRQYVLSHTRRALKKKNSAMLAASLHRDGDGSGEEHLAETVLSVASSGFHIERVLIQQMHDANRISWKTAKDLQANITMVEAEL